MGMEGPNLNNNEEKDEQGAGLSRRDFLKFAVAGVASLALNPEEIFAESSERTEIHTHKFEMSHAFREGERRFVAGEGTDLEALHQDASNGLEAVIEQELKDPKNKFVVRNFHTKIGREHGKYILKYTVDLIPVQKEENAHRVFSIRGKVWHKLDGGAKDGVYKLYNNLVIPWQKSMYEKYPKVDFHVEVQEDGTDTLYHKACVMSGGERSRE